MHHLDILIGMIKSIETIVSDEKRRGKKLRRILHLQCDYCGKQFSGGYTKDYAERERHYCSKSCNNKCPIKKQKIVDTNLLRYGVTQASKSDIIKQRQVDTTLKKFGVTCVAQLPENVKKSHSPESKLKRQETLKKNQTLARSKMEIELFERLSLSFDMKPNMWIAPRYSIDMFSVDTNTHVQFDGVHWHGLETHDETGSHHTSVISKKYELDREFDKIVEDKQMRLIRVTDKCFRYHEEFVTKLVADLMSDTSWCGVKYVGDHFSKLGLGL